MQVNNIDLFLTLFGIIYGAFLIVATFVSNKVTEALRIDALLRPQPTEATRKVNLVVGLALIGYNIYTLI